jgi:type I restriction enzyme M protein
LRALRRDLTIGYDDAANPADALREAYGARPDEEFIREAWPTLLKSWLPTATESREQIVHALQEAHRDNAVMKGRGAQLAYLKDLRNAKRLRAIVWDEFVAAGEAEGPTERDGDKDHEKKSSKSHLEQTETARASGRKPSDETNSDSSKEDHKAKRSQAEHEVDAVLTLAGLERRLWDAANALRGPVDPADFKNYVFPMLFWKWISDTWEYERAQAVADYGDDLTDEIEADYHQFDLPAEASWKTVTNKTTNIGHQIAVAFRKIEQANPQTLAAIFGDAAWANKERLPEAALRGLITAFNQTTLNPATVSHDMLGQAYEYLLKNFADESGKKAGEFFTPRSVVHLLASILNPQHGEEVYDPACGSGGMLVETINLVKSAGGDARTLRLYGQEINLTTSAIARMNLFFHDIEDSKILRGDVLREPKLHDAKGALRQFDVVVANPPFSLTNWGAEKWAADPRAFCGVPPATKGDYAFIQHMITSMKPVTGRVGVVMPHGVLFRGGAEAKIRQCLVEKDQLEAIIGLPPNLFYSTEIPACLLIFRAEKSEQRRNHILFIDAAARFVTARNQNTMSAADVEAVLAAYRTGEDPDGEGGVKVRLVPFDEIKSNGFDLNIGRYVKSASGDTSDLPTAISEYQAARAARVAAEERMFEVLTAAGIEFGDE